MTRVLIADDQQLLRAGFAKLLTADEAFTVVGQASDGLQAVELCRLLLPDVVLMDIRMPNLDGIQATRRITQDTKTRTVQVLILTTYDLDEYVYDALRAGASGFLLKDSPPDSLISAIDVIARGEALLAPTITRRLITEFAHRRSTPDDTALAVLSPREREVLIHLGRGLSNQEIAARLYLGATTVKSHVSNILTKLHCRDRVQAVVLAYETGLIQPGTR